MRKRRNAGFTLVEIVVSMGLMSTAMVMILTMSVLLFNFTHQEDGFTAMMNELADARALVTSFVSDRDVSGGTLSAASGLCASDGAKTRFLSAEEVRLASAYEKPLPVPEPVEPEIESAEPETETVYALTAASFSRYEVDNTLRCALRWGEGAAMQYNFDALSWVSSDAAASAEQRLTDWLFDAFAACENITVARESETALSITAGDTTGSVVWHEDEKSFRCTVQEEGESAKTRTVRCTELSGAHFTVEDDGSVLCHLSYAGFAGISYNASFSVSLHPAVMRARCTVLSWVREAVQDGMTEFSVAAHALQSTDSGGGREALCFLSAQERGDYSESAQRIYWRSEGDNRLAATDRSGMEGDSITDAEFTVSAESGDVRCTVLYTKKGKECRYTFLAPRRTAD